MEFYWIVIAGGVISFIAAYGIGANDVANSFASSVGSKSISLNKAIAIAGLFEFLGTVLLGSVVTDTVRKKIISPDEFEDRPELLMMGMFAALLSVAFWLLCATVYELPVSTTHSTIGAIVGVGIVLDIKAVNWDKIGLVVASWFISPLLSGLISGSFFFTLRKYVLRSTDSFDKCVKVNAIQFLCGSRKMKRAVTLLSLF